MMQWYHTFVFVLIIALQAANSTCQQLKAEYAFNEHSNAMSLFSQDLKDYLEQMCKQNSKLKDTLQKIQEKQTMAEHEFSRHMHAVRTLLESAGFKLGEMLLSATKDNDAPRVQILLQLGAPIESQDSEGNRPIHIAAQNRHTQVLEILLENQADIESKGEDQKTALHVVGYSECLECAKILIKKGAKLESRDAWRNTPIIHPALVGFDDIVEFLIQKGANINAGRMDGVTSLHFAASRGRLSTVKLLVQYGADVHLKSEEGKTALDYAITSNHSLTVEFLKHLKPN